MNEQQGIPSAQTPLLNNYRVACLNGWSINVASPMDLATFWKIARADGYISADKMAINFANIVSVEYIGPYNPSQNVVQGAFGQQPQVVQP